MFTVNTTSSSIADSTTTIGLVPTATRATVSFTSSSLYSSPQSSVYDETNPSSLRSTRTFKTHGSSFNKGGGGTCTSSLATGTQTILTEFESSSHITTNTVHTINTFFSTLRLNESDASESFWVPRHSVKLTVRPSLVSTSSEFRDFERTGATKGMFLSKMAAPQDQLIYRLLF